MEQLLADSEKLLSELRQLTAKLSGIQAVVPRASTTTVVLPLESVANKLGVPLDQMTETLVDQMNDLCDQRVGTGHFSKVKRRMKGHLGPRMYVNVAYDPADGRLKGVGVLNLWGDAPEVAGEVDLVCASPAKGGVGSMVLKDIEQEAERRGVHTLFMFSIKEAAPFYEKQGYVEKTRGGAAVFAVLKPLLDVLEAKFPHDARGSVTTLSGADQSYRNAVYDFRSSDLVGELFSDNVMMVKKI